MDETENFSILLIEDEEAHAALIKKNLKRSGVNYPFFHVADGQKALSFIKKEKEYANLSINPSCMLILLDLNLPKLDGFQLLERIRSIKEMHSTLVFVLSSTTNQNEIDKCYHLGCNLYLIKPMDYQTFSNMVVALGALLQTVKIPEK